jgi:signal transduction histidine kinase/CheY-like chemotaxis protein
MDPVNATPFSRAAGRQIRLAALDLSEAGHWRQLTEMIRALTCIAGTHDLLSYFLSAALELLEADRGHVRMLDRSSQQLILRVQHGFDGLSASDFTALCATPVQTRALQMQRRVMIEDSEQCEFSFQETFVAIFQRIGCRAIQATPLIDSSGRILGLLTTYNDTPYTPGPLQLRLLDALCLQVVALFERAEEKELLVGAERHKDDFLATLAHELRNSIAPLRSSLEVLKLAPLEHPLHERARAILDRRLHHTTRLIDDLLDVSRISCGKLELHREHVALASVLDSAIETVGPVIAELDHELTTSLPDNDVIVWADPVRLAQVFVNLLQNAAKYTPRQGSIHLSTRKHADAVEIDVRDSGIGITTEILPHIFERFTQAPAAVRHQGGGLGIGLALVKGMVEMHGGSVRVDSPGRDRGTTFTVWLPLARSDPKSPPVSGIQPLVEARTRRLRVLVVDDDVDAAEALGGLLTMHGHQVRTARDGAEAIEITRHYHPDLILLDAMMPNMGGIEAAERIRELPLPRQPEIIELSGAPDAEDSLREAAAGISAHLLKPVEFATLDAVVQAAARNIEALRETRLQFLINNIDLACTLLTEARRCGDQVTRVRSLGNARRAFERATALLGRLDVDPSQRKSIDVSLQQLKAELLAQGELQEPV